MKLSVCYIVKNEILALPYSISRTKLLADEICIVDTGSTDGTKEYAKSVADKYQDFEWCDNFSAARNASLKLATGDWILILDADESIESNLIPEIQKLLLNKTADAYTFTIIHFHQDPRWIKNPKFLIGAAIRLFRNNSKYFYEGIVHNKLNIKNSIITKLYVYNFEWYEREKIDWKCEQNKKLMDRKISQEGWSHVNYVHYADIYRKLWNWKGDTSAAIKAVHYMNEALKLKNAPNLIQVRDAILQGVQNVKFQTKSPEEEKIVRF